MMDAYDFVKDKGIVVEADYPYSYVAHQNKECYSINGKKKYYLTGAKEEDNISNSRLKQILMNCPMVVSLFDFLVLHQSFFGQSTFF